MFGIPLSILVAEIPAALTGVAYWLRRHKRVNPRPPLLMAVGFAALAAVLACVLYGMVLERSVLLTAAASPELVLPALLAGPVCAMIVERRVWPLDGGTPSHLDGTAT